MSFEVLAEGLQFPEGPIAMADGSVILVEIARETLTRVMPDGKQHVIAKLGGGPNGAAMGPGGKIYVCNNGGFNWIERPGGRLFPGTVSADYKGGSIQVVDPESAPGPPALLDPDAPRLPVALARVLPEFVDCAAPLPLELGLELELAHAERAVRPNAMARPARERCGWKLIGVRRRCSPRGSSVHARRIHAGRIRRSLAFNQSLFTIRGARVIAREMALHLATMRAPPRQKRRPA